MMWISDQQKILVIDSDTKWKCYSAGDCSCTSTAEWTEDNISQKLEELQVCQV